MDKVREISNLVKRAYTERYEANMERILLDLSKRKVDFNNPRDLFQAIVDLMKTVNAEQSEALIGSIIEVVAPRLHD